MTNKHRTQNGKVALRLATLSVAVGAAVGVALPAAPDGKLGMQVQVAMDPVGQLSFGFYDHVFNAFDNMGNSDGSLLAAQDLGLSGSGAQTNRRGRRRVRGLENEQPKMIVREINGIEVHMFDSADASRRQARNSGQVAVVEEVTPEATDVAPPPTTTAVAGGDMQTVVGTVQPTQTSMRAPVVITNAGGFATTVDIVGGGVTPTTAVVSSANAGQGSVPSAGSAQNGGTAGSAVTNPTSGSGTGGSGNTGSGNTGSDNPKPGTTGSGTTGSGNTGSGTNPVQPSGNGTPPTAVGDRNNVNSGNNAGANAVGGNGGSGDGNNNGGGDSNSGSSNSGNGSGNDGEGNKGGSGSGDEGGDGNNGGDGTNQNGGDTSSDRGNGVNGGAGTTTPSADFEPTATDVGVPTASPELATESINASGHMLAKGGQNSNPDWVPIVLGTASAFLILAAVGVIFARPIASAAAGGGEYDRLHATGQVANNPLYQGTTTEHFNPAYQQP